MALEDKTPPEDLQLDPALVAAIRAHLVEDKLPCGQAFRIVEDLDVTSELVGKTADALGIRLSRCQLGLFGYPGKQGWSAFDIDEHPVSDELRAAIRGSADVSGNLPCIQAWKVADQYDVPRMLVGYIADQLGIRIVSCQLGAF